MKMTAELIFKKKLQALVDNDMLKSLNREAYRQIHGGIKCHHIAVPDLNKFDS